MEMRPLKLVVTFLLLAFASRQVSAQMVAISNLADTSAGTVGAVGKPSTYQEAGNSFTTGASMTDLQSVTIKVSSETIVGSSTALSLAIYSNNGGVPGTLLTTLSGPSAPSIGQATYTETGTFALAAGTTYWVVASVSGSDSDFNLTTTTSTTTTGLSGWEINSPFQKNDSESSPSWFAGGKTLEMGVDTLTPVPEPADYGIITGVSGLLFAFVLRRRTA
jgi:hypothetical protein